MTHNEIMQPLDFMVKTYGFWFEEIERPAALMSEAGGSEETTTKMKSWFALTLQVKYNNSSSQY